MAADKKNLSEVAKGLGLTEIDTASAVSYLRDDILLTMWRRSNESSLRDRIERVYKEWHPGGEFKDDNLPIAPTFLIGPPCQRKATSFKVACQEVSKALGLRYLENGDIDKAINNGGIQPTDFVFVLMDAAQASPDLVFANVQAKTEYEKIRAQRIQALEHAGGGCLLLDNFFSAPAAAQKISLELACEVSVRGRFATGMTGHMELIDGTHPPSRLSTLSTLRDRFQVSFVQDKLDNFIARTKSNPNYLDDISDLGVCAFLAQNPQFFKDDFLTPQSWDKFIQRARKEVKNSIACGQSDVDFQADFRLLSASLLGLKVSVEYMLYLANKAECRSDLGFTSDANSSSSSFYKSLTQSVTAQSIPNVGCFDLGDPAPEVIVITDDAVMRGQPIEITDENVDHLMTKGMAVFGRGGTDLIGPSTSISRRRENESNKERVDTPKLFD